MQRSFIDTAPYANEAAGTVPADFFCSLHLFRDNFCVNSCEGKKEKKKFFAPLGC